MKPIHTGECYDLWEAQLIERERAWEKKQSRGLPPVLYGFLLSIPLWVIVITAGYFIAGWIR